MVALNFSPQFASEVALGIKRQTIRRDTIAKPGDRLQCYTGQRTKRCVKLIACDPVCISVQPVVMNSKEMTVDGVQVEQGNLDAFARADGFKSFAEMWEWFAQRYRCDKFNGKLIKWKSWAEARDE